MELFMSYRQFCSSLEKVKAAIIAYAHMHRVEKAFGELLECSNALSKRDLSQQLKTDIGNNYF